MADADHSICSVEECERSAHVRGFCKPHYERWQYSGDANRYCKECGKQVPIKGDGGKSYCSAECRSLRTAPSRMHNKANGKYFRKCVRCGSPTPSNRGSYCSDRCRPICAAGSCLKPADGLQDYCDGHMQRLRKYGTVVLPCTNCGVDIGMDRFPKTTCSDACDPSCAEEGCSRRPWTTSRCATHEARLRRQEVVASYRETNNGRGCVVCERPLGDDTRRMYCSSGCNHYAQRHPDIQESLLRTCGSCGESFSLLETLGGRDRRHSGTKTCLSCSKRNFHIARIHAPTVVETHGSVCGICGDGIDLSLKFPHKQSLTIDHVVPWSLGGSHELDNLRPAHLVCNARRGNNLSFKSG